MKRALLVIGYFLLVNALIAQSGPGGVGASTSSSDSLMLWLRADSLVGTNGSSQLTWTDISGNGHVFTSDGTEISLVASGVNGRPVIDFNSVSDERLLGPNTAEFFGENSSLPERIGDIFVVFQQEATAQTGYISQFPLGDNNNSFITLWSNSSNDNDIALRYRNGGTLTDLTSSGSSQDNNFTLSQFHATRFGFDPGVGDSVWLYYGDQLAGSVTGLNLSYNGDQGDGPFRIGGSGAADAQFEYKGQIAEYLVFGDKLSEAAMTVVMNYLNARYGAAITINDDFYVGTGYAEDVLGIGNNGTSNHMTSTGSGGGLYISGTVGASATTFDEDEWVFAGHDGGVTSSTFADVPDVGKKRVTRVWKLEKTEGASNPGFDMTITFDLGELNLVEFPGLTLYKRTSTTGDFTNLGLTPSVSGDQISFTLTDATTDDAEQYYTLAFDSSVPGGVSANLALWLQSDAGVNTTGSAVDSWDDQSGNANDAVDPSALTELQTNTTNFNPGISFDGDATSLEGSVTTTGSNFTFFAVFEDNSAPNSGGALFEFNSGGQSQFLLDNAYAGGGAFTDNIDKDQPSIISIDHPSGTTADIYQNGTSFESTYTTVANSAAGTYNYTLGDDDDGGNTFTGTLNELIAYEGTLTANQREQVESHLAIKYGISLGHDYLRSDGTLIFDVDNSALNDGYENDITGIGTDVSSGLIQKASRSINDSLFIALEADYTSSNSVRTTSLGDDSFFFVSNDGGDFSTTVVSGNERLNRVWKVNESGTVGTVYLGIPTSISEFDSLLVSTDPTFTTGVTRMAVTIQGNFNSTSYDFSDGEYFTFTVDQNLSSDNENLLVWLRADQGVTTSGNNVTLWADQSSYGNDADDDDTELDDEPSLADQDEDPVTYVSQGFNFNPSIASTGADRPITGEFTSTIEGATIFIVGREEEVSSDNHAWFDTFDDGAGTGAAGRTYFFENAYNGGADFAQPLNEDTLTIYSVDHPSSAVVDIYENGFLYQDDYSTSNPHAPGLHHYVLFDDITGGNEFIGQIAEFMYFQGSLTATERQSIESYLAIKYAVQMQSDYITSDGTVVFDVNSTLNDDFENNIIALAKDDLLSLDQKVAKTEFGNLVISLEEDFESSNAARSSSLNTGQYFFVSSNTGSVASDSSYRSFAGNRLGRKWKVNETNNPGAVYVAISDTVAANFNVLIISTDSTFSNGVTEVPLLQDGGFYYITNDFSDGEYFTFANSVSPGGVGEGLQVWLKADTELTVDDWGDQSGNDNDAVSPENDPTIVAAGINFNPALQFSTAGDRMQGTINTTTDSLSFLVVAEDRSGASSGGVLIEFDAATDLTFNDGSYAGLSFTSPNNIIKDTAQLISVVHPEGAGPATVYKNGASFEIGAVNAAASTAYTYAIGDDVASNNGFDGLISEVIVYDEALTDASREMLESYLAVKYALPVRHDIVASDGSVVLNATASSGYLDGLFGLGYDVRTQLDQKVGKSPYDSLRIATTNDFATANTSRSTAFDDLQYTLLTNDGGDYTITSDYKAESNVRLDRVWEVHELNNPGTVVLALPNTGVFTSINTMLISSDPTFTTGVTERSLAVSGDYRIVSVDLTDGQYLSFTTADPESSIWYSYLSGNWSNPANWTLDGAISPLYLNPSNEIPSEGDTVVIKSGRTVTTDINGVLVERVEILGTLNLAATAGHDFNYLFGDGTLRLAGASSVDNYPIAEDSLFYSSTEGGSVEYYGDGLTLNTKRKYNNLIINLTDASDEVVQTADSIWVFGNMTVTQGKYQFGSNSVADDEVAEVRGDVLVEANGGIEVGTTNARHEFNLYGDFTNQGIVEFTNRTSADFDNEATDGIVDVNFVSATQDQTVDLQNTTIFYRMEINKGVDDTYKVSLSADDGAYFSLFGFSNQGHGSVAQLTTNSNALGLLYGTVELGNNIQINELTDNGNYNVSEGASIILNGGSLSGSRWIVTYGSLIMEAGTLDLGIGSVLRNSGFWEVNGGTVDMGHFRTSDLGAGNDGSWTQTGGIVNLTGSGSQSDYYTFSLTYETCSFIMTGGQLNISPDNSSPTGGKGIFLNSSPENTTVTGGTVTLNMAYTENDSLFVTSTAPFYNLTFRQSVANANPESIFIVRGGNSGGSAPDGVTLSDQTLVVYNDLTVDNSDGNTTTIDFDGNDVEIVGNLVIENGSVVDFSELTVRMNGAGSSEMDIQLASTLVLDSLEIDKNDGVNVNIINGQSTALQIDDYLSITGGNFNIDTYDITVNGDLNIADTIGTATSTGIIYMNGGSAQTITSSNGAIYDLEIDNANGVSLDGDLGIINQLDLNAGILDIGTDNLVLTNPVQTTGTFASDLMIITAGNDSDGGLSIYFDADETITFPLGSDTPNRYTPVDVTLDAAADNGFVTLNPVDLELQLLDQSITDDALTYYWKSTNSGFSGSRTVSYVLNFIDASDDVPAADAPETDYIPGWVEGTTRVADPVNSTAGDGMTTTSATTSSHTLVDAKYTAAAPAKFAGDIRIVYTVNDGEWFDPDTWDSDDPSFNTGVDLPGPGDIVQVGTGSANFHVAICDGLNGDNCNFGASYAPIDVAQVSILRDGSGESSILSIDETASDHSLGIITNRAPGETTESTRSSKIAIAGPTLPSGDFGEFNSAPNTIFAYTGRFPGNVTGARNISGVAFNTVGSYTISNAITEYPTVQFESSGGSNANDNDAITLPDVDITINGQIRYYISSGFDSYVIFNDAGTTVDVLDNLRFNNNNSILEFPANPSAPSTLIVRGNIDYDNRTGCELRIEQATGNATHSVQVHGNIESTSSSSVLDLYFDGTTNANLEFVGEENSIFESFAVNPDLYRMIINKGTDTTYTVDLQENIVLNGDNTTAPQSLELQNGKLILNSSSLSIELADNSNFNIPNTSGLEVTQGTITSTDANVILGGLLRINGGTVNLGSTDIEYTSTGSSLIDISSGTLNVGGQIRRSLTSSNGVLKYRQTGGDVDIATDVADNNTRGSFEVLNTGSEFTLTGGTFNIERGVTGDANVSLRLSPETFDLTGSTITIFENLGSNYGSNYFNISSAISLNNLTVANTINLPDARLFNQNLTVNDLTLNTNQALLANGFNVTINGDLTNNGSYTNMTAETILAGSGGQSISGSGSFTIYDLRKNGNGTTTSAVALDVDHDLFLEAGTIDVGTNSLNVGNDAFIESTFTNTGGNGLVFNGTTNQELNGQTNSTVDIGTITISNTNGVDIPDGNGFDFNITQELRLDGGVFNIGGSLVTMEQGAPITEVSPFGVNNMVQTNSSFTDNGLRIEFYGVDSDTVVFFPIGELKYTPVQFDLNTGTTAGNIRVRPANERHPTIVDDAEPATVEDPEIDDTQNVLQYHWIVVAEDMTNASGSAVFFYDHDDITNIETDTANFISARLLANDVNWDKFAPTFFRGASQTFEVPLSSFTASEITGDYTAGAGSSDGINADIEGAIPNQLAQYETNFVGTGNYSEAINWNTLNGPNVTDGVGPVGAQIIVRNGDDLTLDLNNIRLYSAEIESGGVLRVPAGVTGVRLGTVTGSGTIVLEDNELLPTGEYTTFLACDGGALQYSGTTTYSVLSGISQIRKVVFEGSGIRTMPNNDLIVCDTLLINGPTVAFNSGRTRVIGDAVTDRLRIQAGTITLSNSTVLDIAGDFIMEGGSFTGVTGTRLEITDDVTYSGGTLNFNGTSVLLNGATEQLIDGAFTGVASFDNLTINNASSTGVTINSGDVVVDGILTLTDGLVNTSSSETLTLSSSGSWTGATSASYVTGPLTKNSIAATSTFRFPIGKSARYAPASVVNVGVGGDNWTAEYFTATGGTYSNGSFDTDDPGSGFNALISVRNTDRWQITSAGSNTAQVRATYGSHNGFANTESIRLVWWDDEAVLDGDAAQNRWENQGGQVAGTTSSGTVTSENTIFFSTRQIALGYAPESLLPVDLLDFSAVAMDNKIKLYWSTASELNNDYFEIFHSTDGVEFESIGIVNGNGTTNEVIEYGLTHKNPALGDNYYRLRQVDYDGTATDYEVLRIYNDYYKASMEVTIYPNPATSDNLSLKIETGDNHTPISVRIVGIDGLTHYQRVLNGSLSFDEKVTPQLRMNPGIYYVIIQQGEQTKTQKLIVR